MRCCILLISLFCISCASFYQASYEFNKDFESGNLEQALRNLQQNEIVNKGRNKFLLYVNNGQLYSMLGRYDESNENFEKAFLFGEDYHKDYLTEAASYLVNPTITVYRGEDHEHLYLLYYKALNFLKQNRYEEALVECRRLNIRLQQLGDKYQSEKKFQRDAFVHVLMGIIYQASKDWNNAFIAYRNALEIYEDDYAKLFNAVVPEQLKVDLLNTAWRTGLKDEFESYRQKFNMPDYEFENNDAELIFFWHNGLAPVKEEWGINFVVDHSSDNAIVFTNDNMGVSFPFQIGNYSRDEKRDLSDLEVIRVAFPRYVNRPVYYQSAKLMADTVQYELQKAEDINQIAFYSLQQRMLAELSKGLLRAAIKKAAEKSVRKEDKKLGAMVGFMNAMTERADTRNWQTLPNSIYYSRVPLKVGENQLEFTLGQAEQTYRFTYQVKKDQTLFHTYTSLESRPAGNY
ncbi:MAG: hypothetical protein L0Y35_07270 [Flammeovirgaceae bacterium]|nr:hypothetical protein [Flammeovirgaceae bacterium]